MIYDIDECLQGTSHQVRLDSDQKQVISVLSSLMPDISKLSVRDCTRMGKYSPSHVRPRPLLVKLLRTTEVSVILSNRSKLTKSKVYIKPYMTPSKRNSESILLKERKSLISSGANPKDIKGKSNKLLLNGSVYGSVQGSSFSLNVQNSIQVSSDSHVDVDPVAHAVVQGERVNKGAGYGLEVPCIYRVFGPPVYVCRMKELVNRGTSVMNVKLVLAFI